MSVNLRADDRKPGESSSVTGRPSSSIECPNPAWDAKKSVTDEGSPQGWMEVNHNTPTPLFFCNCTF